MSSPLVVSVPEESLAAALRALDPPVDVVVWDLSGPAPREHIDVVVPDYLAPKTRLANLANLNARLIQSQSIGYDGVARTTAPGSVYANAASVHETSTAELAVALILAAQRGLAEFVRAGGPGPVVLRIPREPRRPGRSAPRLRRGRARHRGPPHSLRSRHRARGAHAPDASGASTFTRGTSCPRCCPAPMSSSCRLPLTEETTRMVDARFLSHMSDHSLLVNVGRGPLVDTDALLAEAASARLRFAIDVVDPEPLPEHHPLFVVVERTDHAARRRGHQRHVATGHQVDCQPGRATSAR